MSEGEVQYRTDAGVAFVTFDRPKARNAMTWRMYEALARACDAVVSDKKLRVAVFRGVGGAFVAGTDIQQFTEFKTADDGIEYEKHIDAAVAQIEALPVPVIAVIDGWCTGGGLAIAGACDIRLATPQSRFGVPIARTLGNCLSVGNVARLVAHFGPGRVKRMLMLADMIGAEEALACGFLVELAGPDAIGGKAQALAEKLKTHAPLTMRAAKEAVRRSVLRDLPDGADLVRMCYGSADFHEGVDAFLAKRTPDWKGR